MCGFGNPHYPQTKKNNLKIFRNTRKGNLKKGNTFNYLGYALGEIILVVLGILIAVSINNWNEKTKHEKELLNIFSIIKTDLKNDIAEINDILGHYEKTKNIYGKILDNSISREEYFENNQYPFLTLGYPEISFDKRGFNLLSNNINKTESYQDTLVTDIIEFYNERLLEIKVDDEFRASDFKANYEYYKKTFDWWPDFIKRKKIEGFVGYALNDPDYKNRIASTYFLTYDVYLPEIELFKVKAKEIIGSIEKRENK